MNSIYEQKAKKYKYKYLKLKKEYIGGDDNYTIQKYVVQTSQKNIWIDPSDWQIKLINSQDKNCNSIDINNINTYIYFGSLQEIIKSTDNYYEKYKCISLKLPKHSGIININKSKLDDINKIIKYHNLKNININTNINNKYYYDLFFIQSKTVNEWNNCTIIEVWKQNIVHFFLNYQNYYQNYNKELLNLLSEIHITNKYLLFKYNNTNYISYIIKNNSNKKNDCVQLIIINLFNGHNEIIYFPLILKLANEDNIDDDYKKKLDNLIINVKNVKPSIIKKLFSSEDKIKDENDENISLLLKNFQDSQQEIIQEQETIIKNEIDEKRKKQLQKIIKIEQKRRINEARKKYIAAQIKAQQQYENARRQQQQQYENGYGQQLPQEQYQYHQQYQDQEQKEKDQERIKQEEIEQERKKQKKQAEPCNLLKEFEDFINLCKIIDPKIRKKTAMKILLKIHPDKYKNDDLKCTNLAEILTKEINEISGNNGKCT
jgi:hypothetical protein